MKSLIGSRRFWIMIADVVVSTATYFVAHYMNAAGSNDVLWLIGAWQPVIYAVINGLTQEDTAKIAAKTP
jgi:hypothetical protein